METRLFKRGDYGAPELRFTIPVNEWVKERERELSREAAPGERVILFPHKVYLKMNPPGRRLSRYRVRRDGHLMEYVAIAVPEDFDFRTGRHGGWVPGSGAKPKPLSRQRKRLNFKLSQLLVERAAQLGEWESPSAMATELVLKGLEALEAGGKSVPVPPSPSSPGICNVRMENLRWEQAQRFREKQENISVFMRRLLWLGILAQENSKNPPVQGG